MTSSTNARVLGSQGRASLTLGRGPGGILTRLLTVAMLAMLPACGDSNGGGSAEAAESGSSSSRTRGIFGGSVQPGSSGDREASPPPPISTPGDADPGGAEDGGGSPAPAAAPGGQVPEGQMDVTDMGYTVGSADAPIQVIEFSDFGCGFCRRFHMNTYPTLHEEFVETGQVAWKYIPFVLGIFPNGEEAAIAGECVLRHGRRSFPEFRDRLFRNQGEWRDLDEPSAYFVEAASDAGVDSTPMRRCVQDEGTAEQVQANNAVGRRIGLRGTPSFLVNGFPLHGAQPLEIFRNIFEDMLNNPPSPGDGR